ncbi:hypothetical protein D3C81_881420 [compost metagenome]
MVVLTLPIIRAADHRFDVAVARIDRDQGRFQLWGAPKLRGDRRLRRLLCIGIQRRIDVEPAVFEQRLVEAEFSDHHIPNIIAEIRGLIGWALLLRRLEFQQGFVRLVGFLLRDLAGGDHCGQHGPLTVLGVLHMIERRIIGGAFRNSGQERAFRKT